jgi:GT2 family glycosyltransferase
MTGNPTPPGVIDPLAGGNPGISASLPSKEGIGSSPLGGPTEKQESEPHVFPTDFDEIAYLEAYPDIAAAVRSGEWRSGWHHYRTHGAGENRLADTRYLRAVFGCTSSFPAAAADRMCISKAGRCLISGWVSDSEEGTFREILVRQDQRELGITRSIARCRREDAEQETITGNRLLGFWAVLDLDEAPSGEGEIQLRLTAGKERNVFSVKPAASSDEQLRDDALLTIANARYFDDPETATFLQLDQGAGGKLIDWNAVLVSSIAQGAYQMRFGERRSKYFGSIIVVLYGKAEFLTLQAALFSECPGYEQYEYIYISNSPELNDILVRDATNVSRVYGIAITLILLPGNVGFGVANNVAAAAAESDRLIFVNPDVMPREPYWPRIHQALIESLPSKQTALFGVPLYYGDGSLMHGGTYIDMRGGCSVQNGRVIRREILQVEHYGKGALAGTPQYVTSRPVPAVTGAFMSMDRAWFERLGGFSPKFIFGHYEDVDLCLRSLEAGSPAWLHDIPFLHLESVGSHRTPLHGGGRMVNRWHLTEKWGDLVRSELNGPSPARFRNSS